MLKHQGANFISSEENTFFPGYSSGNAIPEEILLPLQTGFVSLGVEACLLFSAKSHLVIRKLGELVSYDTARLLLGQSKCQDQEKRPLHMTQMKT